VFCNSSYSVLTLSEAPQAEQRSCLVRRLISDSSRLLEEWESESVDRMLQRETSRSSVTAKHMAYEKNRFATADQGTNQSSYRSA